MNNQTILKMNNEMPQVNDDGIELLYARTMPLSEYERGKQTFNDFFKLANGPNNLGTVLRFKYAKIKRLVEQSEINEDRAAIVIYHGLKNDMIVHGIRVVKVLEVENQLIFEPELEIGPGSLPTHWIKNNNFDKLRKSEIIDWMDYQKDYFREILINRSGTVGGQFDALDTSIDPKAVIYLWAKELKKLYEDNRTDDNQNTLEYGMIDFSDILKRTVHGDIFAGHDGLRHSIAFYMYDSSISSNMEVHSAEGLLLNNDEPITNSFKDKGLDYGNLCPPRCKDFK